MPATTSKLVKVYGLLGKLESSYGGGGTPSTSTDGILLEELATFKYGYAYDGARPTPPGTVGTQKRVPPTGRFADLTAKLVVAGAGAAYSASIYPHIHVPLRIAGLDAVVVTTPGAEKWTYSPNNGAPAVMASGVFSVYGRGQLYGLTAAYADFTYTIDGPKPPVLEVAIKGLASLPTDVACPAITYLGGASLAPSAVNVAFTLGNFTSGIVRKLTLKWQRKLDPRLDINSGGHGGFTPGGRAPTVEVQYETPALTGSPYTSALAVDPFSLFDTGASVAWSWAVGGAQYYRHNVSGPSAQLIAPPEEAADGATAITKLQLQINPSALGANDDMSWVFN